KPEKDPGSGIWTIFRSPLHEYPFRHSVVDYFRPAWDQSFLGIFYSYPAGSFYRDFMGGLLLYPVSEKTDPEPGSLCLRRWRRLAENGKRKQQQKRLFPYQQSSFLPERTGLHRAYPSRIPGSF